VNLIKLQERSQELCIMMASSPSSYDTRWQFATPFEHPSKFPGNTTFEGGPTDPTFWNKGLLNKRMSIVMDVNLGVAGEGFLSFQSLGAAINPPPGAHYRLEKASFYGKKGGNLAIRDLLTDLRVIRDVADGSRRTAIHISPAHGVRKQWVQKTSPLVPFAIKEFSTDTTRQRITVCAVVVLRSSGPYDEARRSKITAEEWKLEKSPLAADAVDWAREVCAIDPSLAREHFLAGHHKSQFTLADPFIECPTMEHCTALDRCVENGLALPQAASHVYADAASLIRRVESRMAPYLDDPAIAALQQGYKQLSNEVQAAQTHAPSVMMAYDGEAWKVESPQHTFPKCVGNHPPSVDCSPMDEGLIPCESSDQESGADTSDSESSWDSEASCSSSYAGANTFTCDTEIW